MDVEREWKDFWEPIVTLDGQLDLEQVKKELYDYRVVMREVSKVYYHITGGKFSKPNTDHQYIIDEVESRFERSVTSAEE